MRSCDSDPGKLQLPKALLPENPRPLIEECQYDLVFVEYHTKLYRGCQAKLELTFKVTSGQRQGTHVPRFYNVACLVGPPGLYGQFEPQGMNSNFIRDYLLLFPDANEVDMNRFIGLCCIGDVTNTSKDSNGKKLPLRSQYSRVNSLRPTLFDSRCGV
jgi:hypothetical protein